MKKLFNVVLLVLCVTSCELLRPWTPVYDKTQYTKMTVLSLEDNNEYEFLLNRITGPGSGEPYIYKYSSITGEDKYNIGIGGESLDDDNPYSAAAGTLELCVALNHPLTIGEKYYIPSGQSDDY